MKKHRTVKSLPKPSTCTVSGKKRWPDHKSAVQVLHAASTSRHFAQLKGFESSRSEVRAYRCDGCGGWHTTSQPARIAA